jgi:hypothetical protein
MSDNRRNESATKKRQKGRNVYKWWRSPWNNCENAIRGARGHFPDCFPHRFAAACFAMAFRFVADSAFALALPPLLAPSLLKATAAGFRVSFSGGVPGGTGRGPSPRAASATALAIWVKSRRLLARVGMV